MKTSPSAGRLNLFLDNFVTFFFPRSGDHWQWWPHDLAHPLDQGWLYLYLTPPILLLSVLGAAGLFHRRLWRPLVFLAAWTFSLLASVMFANQIFPRYLLLGSVPLLLFAAWFISACIDRLGNRIGRYRLATSTLVIAAVVFWPTRDTVSTNYDPRAPNLARTDRFQHLSGFPSGMAGELLIAQLKELADKTPITIVTSGGLVIKSEYVWVMLSDHPNIQLFRDDNIPPLRPVAGKPNTYLASTEQWPPNPPVAVEIPPDRPIYFVSGGRDLPDRIGVFPSAPLLGPDAVVVDAFKNPVDIPGERITMQIQIIELLTSRKSGPK